MTEFCFDRDFLEGSPWPNSALQRSVSGTFSSDGRESIRFDLKLGDTMRRFGRELQNTPHTGPETESPCVAPPPESSSPLGLSSKSSPVSTFPIDFDVPISNWDEVKEDYRRERQRLDAPPEDLVDTSTTILQAQNTIDIADTLELYSQPDENSPNMSGPSLDDLELSFSFETEDTCSGSELKEHDDISSKIPLRRVSIDISPRSDQFTNDNGLKRSGSSIICPPERKKVKLARTASHTCTDDANVEHKYQATEPASIRRARSLRSEASICSSELTESAFYPSPLSSPISRFDVDVNYPPTLPSTPLPDSVEYARSKVNPLARTIAVYHRRSSTIPVVPPVPIIAPPHRLQLEPTRVRCSEDRAIERLERLLLRERSQRERDGLHVYDEKRTERHLLATLVTDSALRCTGSFSTSSSSDTYSQWEEESTLSASELQECNEVVLKADVPYGQQRLVDRKTWSNAFGITDDFRREVTRWILEKPPREPEPPDRPCKNRRRLGIDLYDQLINSRQTRFHSALLFHRYFLIPERDKLLREVLCEEHDISWKRGIWNVAVACLALSVKLHRDCLPPLGPVFAVEFLDMAPYPMTPEVFELAQRDVMRAFRFCLASCTPQDVLDELWNALPTLRKVTLVMQEGWVVVQSTTWDKLYESSLEPDMLQYPITLLTAAALVDCLTAALARHYKSEAQGDIYSRKTRPVLEEEASDNIEPTCSQIYLFEATVLVDDVILDVLDVLQLSSVELDECRKWLSYVGRE